MSMSCSLSSSHFLALTLSHESGKAYKIFEKEALKAFKKVQVNSVPHYTCNVARLHECRRLGTEKQLSLWSTHFFQCSRHFDEVFAVVFNTRPGEELASFTRGGDLKIYIAMGSNEILDPSNGFRIQTEHPLEFASAEKV